MTAHFDRTSGLVQADAGSSPVDVSVVAANYNNAAFLTDFFESWMASTKQPAELIFVDDGSSDDSLAIARSYAPKLNNLLIIELGQNRGFGNALNVGIDKASRNYIARIDPDDVVLPERLAMQLAVLEAGDADVVGSNAIIFQSNGSVEVGLSNFPRDHDDIERTIRRGEHGVLHPTVTARAELFKAHPYVQGNVPAEDYDIFARMLHAGARFHNLQVPLLRYRIHQRSASNVLPFSTIQKTYRIRDEIFGYRTPKYAVSLYYLHIKFYRKYLFATSKPARIGFLAVASALRPDKALKRIWRNISAAS